MQGKIRFAVEKVLAGTIPIKAHEYRPHLSATAASCRRISILDQTNSALYHAAEVEEKVYSHGGSLHECSSAPTPCIARVYAFARCASIMPCLV